MTDPRDWSLAEATDHLLSVGLSEPRPLHECRFQTADFSHWAFADHQRTEFDGAFLFSNTWDTRVLEAVDLMPPEVRQDLLEIAAHKGTCWLSFWNEPPLAYSEGGMLEISSDSWFINESRSVHGDVLALRRREEGEMLAEAGRTSTTVDQRAVRRSQYRDYLGSPEWRIRRGFALEYYGAKCCLCNSTRKLNVHHRTYERLGAEKLADLIVLCEDCHAKFHGKAA